jgi:hypothetical protein
MTQRELQNPDLEPNSRCLRGIRILRNKSSNLAPNRGFAIPLSRLFHNKGFFARGKFTAGMALSLDDQVFFAPREIFDKAGSKRSVLNEESIVSHYG